MLLMMFVVFVDVWVELVGVMWEQVKVKVFVVIVVDLVQVVCVVVVVV